MRRRPWTPEQGIRQIPSSPGLAIDTKGRRQRGEEETRGSYSPAPPPPPSHQRRQEDAAAEKLPLGKPCKSKSQRVRLCLDGV
jgi:hypothetical protein